MLVLERVVTYSVLHCFAASSGASTAGNAVHVVQEVAQTQAFPISAAAQ